ncbi:hypothetical protein WR25_03889 [Diploscapter pachys]|uniref:Uncharacterized protein n=1 Tax=Diploscapter pachys TaxID=2018661 RepID=A0A2A2JMT6_9BILA|nr:hypothetical protein WR25_03889 [Diploscapter pachys]
MIGEPQLRTLTRRSPSSAGTRPPDHPPTVLAGSRSVRLPFVPSLEALPPMREKIRQKLEQPTDFEVINAQMRPFVEKPRTRELANSSGKRTKCRKARSSSTQARTFLDNSKMQQPSKMVGQST